MKIYEAFKRSKKHEYKTKFLQIYSAREGGTDYRIVITKRYANKFTLIHCVDSCISWEQMAIFSFLFSSRRRKPVPIYKELPDKKCETIFVVKGNPNAIMGLDNGIFGSANRYDPRKINVMSWARFKSM